MYLMECKLFFQGSISLLVDHFLDLFHESILHKMQATMIINELMLGAAGEGGKIQHTYMYHCVIGGKTQHAYMYHCILGDKIQHT